MGRMTDVLGIINTDGGPFIQTPQGRQTIQSFAETRSYGSSALCGATESTVFGIRYRIAGATVDRVLLGTSVFMKKFTTETGKKKIRRDPVGPRFRLYCVEGKAESDVLLSPLLVCLAGVSVWAANHSDRVVTRSLRSASLGGMRAAPSHHTTKRMIFRMMETPSKPARMMTQTSATVIS